MNAQQYFYQFINFSPIACRNVRETLVHYLDAALAGKHRPSFEHDGGGVFFEQWQDALDAILFSRNTGTGNAAAPLVEMPLHGLEMLVLEEIIAFVEKTGAELDAVQTPFAEESALLEECAVFANHDLYTYWPEIKTYIESEYARYEIDADFYEKQLWKNSSSSIHRVKAKKNKFKTAAQLFFERWRNLIYKKTIYWKKEKTKEKAADFAVLLKQKIIDYQESAHIFGLSDSDTQKIFNASKGHLHKTAIDVLRQADAFYKNDFALQELAETLGRGEKLSAMGKPPAPCRKMLGTELCGLEYGGRIDRMTGSESVFMIDADMENLFYQKFAEKELLCYEVKTMYKDAVPGSAQSSGRGPFVLCIDTSGSMKGTPEIAAKSLVYALLSKALKNNRKCYLIMFAMDIDGIELTDFEHNFEALCAFLQNSFYGGTDLYTAIHKALHLLETESYKKADVAVVSDFIMPCLDETTIAKIRRQKETGTRFFSVLIGNSAQSGANPAVTGLFDKELRYRC
ncbi:MAG: VWA domain-containing protein [Spirochaetaceae bacterium]|jgi:uncharacterized protein with von Willebrand factor type A (vWA) domain|nr:VWA domain-containing protein [Spirochaetaceae bacterium]